MISTTCKQKQNDITEAETDYFYYRGQQLVNIIQGQRQSQPGQRFFQTATGLAAQMNVGGNAGTWLIGADALGSVLAGSDGKDALEEHRYAPYGGEKHQETTENVMKLGYTGAYRDPLTGLYPLGNGYRFYLPELMCFNKADSLSPFGAGGINTRSYCEGDPINHSDPSGHGDESEFVQALEDGLEILIGMAEPEALAVRAAVEVSVDATADTTIDAILADVFSEDTKIRPTAVAEGGNDVDAEVESIRQRAAADTQSSVRSTMPETQKNIASTSSATAPKRRGDNLEEPLTKRSRIEQMIRAKDINSGDYFDEWTVQEFTQWYLGPQREIPKELSPNRDYARSLLEGEKRGILKKMGINIITNETPDSSTLWGWDKSMDGISNRNETLVKLLKYEEQHPGATIRTATLATRSRKKWFDRFVRPGCPKYYTLWLKE